MRSAYPSKGRGQRVIRVVACLLLVVAGAIDVGRADAADEAAPPTPISFPHDDGPHQVMTEWWYFSGHLETATGQRYGFEQVTFKARRGLLSGFAAHVAITDSAHMRFAYDQRAVLDNGKISRQGDGFDVRIGDWSMRGADGAAELEMAMSGYAYALILTAQTPPVLQGGDGYVRTKAGAESYYYSWPRLAVSGMLSVDGVAVAVSGEAWMDHQWGDFTAFSVAGWNWFAVQLADDTALMIFQMRDRDDSVSLLVATYVRRDGSAIDLTEDDVRVATESHWTSTDSSATYPAIWSIQLPSERLDLTLTPTMPDQELDTRASTRLTYWEGQVTVCGTRHGAAISGRGYVELTGYTRARDGAVP
jgi:predicted secreted hydrolase